MPAHLVSDYEAEDADLCESLREELASAATDQPSGPSFRIFNTSQVSPSQLPSSQETLAPPESAQSSQLLVSTPPVSHGEPDWPLNRSQGPVPWCAVARPTGVSRAVITILLSVDDNGKISMIPAFPAPIGPWTQDEIRAPLVNNICKAMDAMDLPSCLAAKAYSAKGKNYSVEDSSEVQAIKIANTLIRGLQMPVKMNNDQDVHTEYALEFRQARDFSHVQPGHEYTNHQDLISQFRQRMYRLKRTHEFMKDLKARGDHRWWKDVSDNGEEE